MPAQQVNSPAHPLARRQPSGCPRFHCLVGVLDFTRFQLAGFHCAIRKIVGVLDLPISFFFRRIADVFASSGPEKLRWAKVPHHHRAQQTEHDGWCR